MQQLKTTKLSPARISFTKKYQVWRKNWMKSDTQKSLLQSKRDNLRSEMEEIIEYRTRGAMLRSRTRWHNEGQKNTKYFLNLEKR